MSKQHLIDALTPTLTSKITAFLELQSPEERAYQAQIDEVKKQIEHASIPQVAAALKAVVKDLEANQPDGTVARRQEAALALLHIAHTLKLPLALKESVKGSAKKVKVEGESKQKRLTKVEMAKLSGDVLKVLVEKKSAKIADIATAVGAEVMVVRSALLKLNRDGKAESSGVKGKNGSWKVK